MAESIYCMTIYEIMARMAGRLSFATIRSFSEREISWCSRMRAARSIDLLMRNIISSVQNAGKGGIREYESKDLQSAAGAIGAI